MVRELTWLVAVALAGLALVQATARPARPICAAPHADAGAAAAHGA